ncbi:MAG: FAD-dependent oxidoreductase [Pyrinomonadaceae bacterium]
MAIEKHCDVIVIGGGAAGLSAALWCVDLGLTTVLIEQNNEFGGQLLNIFNPISNYPGIDEIGGVELRDRFVSQIRRISIDLRSGAAIENIDLAARLIRLEDGSVLNSNAIILATGVRRRKLGIPGEDEFAGRGVLDSGVKHRENIRGKRVVIIGGGDAAIENAIILGETAASVTVIHRNEVFRARREFLEVVASMPNLKLVTEHVVTQILGTDTVSGVTVMHANTGVVDLPAEAVLIRIGAAPNSEKFCDQIDLDAAGYIVVDRLCRTSVPGVFAAGDVAEPVSPTIVTAAGMGATAAKAAFQLIRSNTQRKSIYLNIFP